MRRRAGPALALLVAAACGADNGQRADIDACSLLTQREVASALGGEPTPAERYDEGLLTEGDAAGAYSSTCLWLPSAAPPGAEYVIVHAMRWPAGKRAESFLQSFRDAAAEGVIAGDPVSLPIGDSAIWWGDGVAVAKGDISVGVSVRLSRGADQRRVAAERLARTIAARL